MPQDLYKAVFDAAPDGILVVGADGRILEGNPEAHRLFGYPEGALGGLSVDDLVPEAVRGAHAAHRQRFASEPSSRPMGVGMELEASRRDGTTFPVEISLSPIRDGEGLRVIATVRDISTRRRLRDFGAGALRAAEDVRTVIARELHDGTAQELATHLVRLRLLERAEAPEERVAQMAALRAGLDETSEGVRRIARGLRPPELEDAGLLVALQAHARSVEETRQVRVNVRPFTDVDEALTLDGRLALYRIVQEAITNAARHGSPNRVTVEVSLSDGSIQVVVEDDGVGFDLASVERSGGGLGLMGMRERAAILGGRLTIASAGGRGTRVDVALPIEIERETESV